MMVDLFNSGIRPVIDEHLLKLSKEKRDYGEYWSASSAGYCMRKNIFDRLKVPRIETDDDARRQRVFTAGHIFHEWIQKLTKDTGLSIAQEVELQDEELKIRGHFDDLVLVQNGEIGELSSGGTGIQLEKPNLILYDYKTQNSRAFNYKRPEMSHYHKMQLGTYMYMLRKRGTKLTPELADALDGLHVLAEARILKIDKDALRMTEEQLLWSDELELEVIAYWNMLNEFWEKYKKDGSLPPCSCAEEEGGFMANEKWNGRFYNGEPCSIDWFNKCKEEGLIDGE